MIIEVDGEWYISVKGTAKAYERDYSRIHEHIKNRPEIFSGHIIDLKKSANSEKHYSHFTKEQIIAHGKWLDKFAFVEVGTLLRSSPKTIPIKAICFLNK